eukprot:scaffold70981_cov32-Tisochrysis_lutea.AAC.5
MHREERREGRSVGPLPRTSPALLHREPVATGGYGGGGLGEQAFRGKEPARLVRSPNRLATRTREAALGRTCPRFLDTTHSRPTARALSTAGADRPSRDEVSRDFQCH